MKEQNAWVAVAVVVIVAIVAGYFGYIMAGGNNLLSPSTSSEGDATPVGCYGKMSDSGIAIGREFVPGKGDDVFAKAMELALSRCKGSVEDEKKRETEFLAKARNCPKDECVYAEVVISNLDGSSCRVIDCDFYENGKACKHKVNGGVLDPNKTCGPDPTGFPLGIACNAIDGGWNDMGVCVPQEGFDFDSQEI